MAFSAIEIVVVGAIISDVEASIAIDEGQVTIAIESACLTTTDADEVTVVDVVHGSRSIAEYRGGIGVSLGRTRRRVTTGKHSIHDDDTIVVGVRL